MQQPFNAIPVMGFAKIQRISGFWILYCLIVRGDRHECGPGGAWARRLRDGTCKGGKFSGKPLSPAGSYVASLFDGIRFLSNPCSHIGKEFLDGIAQRFF
jgi:hypothetical protein